MSRREMDFDTETLYDIIERGVTKRDAAAMLGCSVPTISKRIADIQKSQGVLMQYRALQALHLTDLQSRILEAITPEKIEQADLKDLVAAYKVLKDKELVVEGKPSEIKGLVSYLVHMEKETLACKTVTPSAEFDDMAVEVIEEKMPDL